MVRRALLSVLLAVFFVSSASAQPVGPEFRVNEATTEFAGAPSVAADPAGGFVVAWSASPSIESPTSDVFARRYDRNGVPRGAELQVSSLTTYGGYGPRVAVNPSGEFVVVWIASSSPHTIWGQRYASSGAVEGAQFRVNTNTAYVGHPAAAWNGNAGFVVVWDRDFPGDGDGIGVFGQRFSAAGAPAGGEFQVGFATTGDQRLPRVAMDGAGRFVVVWVGPDSAGSGVFARHFSDTGAPFGVEFPVNQATTGNQETPDVAAASNGSFVIAWSVAGGAIYARRFDVNGTPLGGDFKVTFSILNIGNKNPSVASDPYGSFVVAWQEVYYPFDLSPAVSDVRAGRVRWSGSPVGQPFRVNTYTTGNQTLPSVAWSYDNFVVAWQGEGEDKGGSLGSLVYAQRFTPGLHGDANGDGSVDIADVFYLINVLFASGPFPFGASDVNGDGNVDVADVFYLINFLFASGPAPS